MEELRWTLPSLSAPPEDAHDLAFSPFSNTWPRGKLLLTVGLALQALLLAQLGGSFPTKNRWQKSAVGFSGDRVAPLTAQPTPSAPSLPLRGLVLRAETLPALQQWQQHPRRRMSSSPEQWGAVIPSACRKQMKFFEAVAAPLLPNRWLEWVTHCLCLLPGENWGKLQWRCWCLYDNLCSTEKDAVKQFWRSNFLRLAFFFSSFLTKSSM